MKGVFFMERVTGLEPATVCLEGRHSSQLSYTRMLIYFFGGPSWTRTSDPAVMSRLL